LNLIADLRGVLRRGFSEARKDFAQELYRFARAEAKFSVSVLGREIPFDFTAKLPEADVFREIVYRRPIHGVPLGERFTNLADATLKRVRQDMRLGFVGGETPERIVSRVRGTQAARYTDGSLGASRRWVETEVRTAVAHAGNGARGAAHVANGSVVKRERFTAVLDARTSLICAGLDGKVFRVGEGAVPPLHMGGCRSMRLPVLKSARELGFKRGELPAPARRALGGDVPVLKNFDRWLRTQTADFQREALGKTRARLWRSGQVKLTRFVDRKHKVLNLEELAAREGLTL
jgi:hypothetical protein